MEYTKRRLNDCNVQGYPCPSPAAAAPRRTSHRPSSLARKVLGWPKRWKLAHDTKGSGLRQPARCRARLVLGLGHPGVCTACVGAPQEWGGSRGNSNGGQMKWGRAPCERPYRFKTGLQHKKICRFFRPGTAEKRVNLTSCMSYTDAEGRCSRWPTVLSIRIAYTAR
jgi:hypothetical protein